MKTTSEIGAGSGGISTEFGGITDKFGFCERCGGDRECPTTRIKEWS